MEGKDFKEVEQKAMEATGKPILDLIVQSKRIHLTKVDIFYWLIDCLSAKKSFSIFRNC